MSSVKKIILTGGSKGLGIEIARYLLHTGYQVHVINRTLPAALEQLQNEYQGKLFIHLYDLANVEELTDFLKKKFPATVFLRAACQMGDKQLIAEFGDFINSTIQADISKTPEEAILEFYRKLRPGEPVVLENAQIFRHLHSGHSRHRRWAQLPA